jgi:hypothetical protein
VVNQSLFNPDWSTFLYPPKSLEPLHGRCKSCRKDKKVTPPKCNANMGMCLNSLRHDGPKESKSEQAVDLGTSSHPPLTSTPLPLSSLASLSQHTTAAHTAHSAMICSAGPSKEERQAVLVGYLAERHLRDTRETDLT